jgi:hypothetical protein
LAARHFCRELAAFLGASFNPNYSRDAFVRYLGGGGRENLSRAISWLTFLLLLSGQQRAQSVNNNVDVRERNVAT